MAIKPKKTTVRSARATEGRAGYSKPKPKATGIAKGGKTKEKFYGKMVPVSSVGGGKVKAPTRSQAAKNRTLASFVVPGGSIAKGAIIAKGAVAANKAKNVGPKTMERLVASGSISRGPTRSQAATAARNQRAQNWNRQQDMRDAYVGKNIPPNTLKYFRELRKESVQLSKMINKWNKRFG
jgi:hypothetical protein